MKVLTIDLHINEGLQGRSSDSARFNITCDKKDKEQIETIYLENISRYSGVPMDEITRREIVKWPQPRLEYLDETIPTSSSDVDPSNDNRLGGRNIGESLQTFLVPNDWSTGERVLTVTIPASLKRTATNLVPSDADVEDSESQSQPTGLSKNQRKNQRRRKNLKASKAAGGESNLSDAAEDTRTPASLDPANVDPASLDPEQITGVSGPSRSRLTRLNLSMGRQRPKKDTPSLEPAPVLTGKERMNARLALVGSEALRRKTTLMREIQEAEEARAKVNEEIEKAKAEQDQAYADAFELMMEMNAAFKKLEADTSADRAKADADRAKAEADRAADRAKIKSLEAKSDADRAKIKSLEAKSATLDSEVNMLKSKVEVLEVEKAHVETRLRAHTQDIDLVFGLTNEVAQYVASQDSFWMNRIRRRAIVVNSQEVLARVLLPGSPPGSKNPPPDSKTWRNMLELEVSKSDTQGRVKHVEKLLSKFSQGKLSFTKTLINTLMTDDLAMQWISEDFGEFRDLGNDAAHPKYSKKVWQEVIDHMSIENQIDEEEKRSLGVLVNVTSYFKNEYL